MCTMVCIMFIRQWYVLYNMYQARVCIMFIIGNVLGKGVYNISGSYGCLQSSFHKGTSQFRATGGKHMVDLGKHFNMQHVNKCPDITIYNLVMVSKEVSTRSPEMNVAL